MAKKPKLKLVSLNQRELALPTEDASLFQEMMDAYQRRRVGSLRHTERSVSRDVSVIHDFIRFTAKAPWYWGEEDFERWCHHLGLERNLVPASQRHYQSVIRNFLKYIIENVRFKNDVQQRYGISMVQICHRENCIPHVSDSEVSANRRALTYDELDVFFQSLDEAIEEAARFGAKGLRPLQRDKALFYLIYICGLRISEALGCDKTSFTENAALPEFGRYGFVAVWGKGSRGSGPKRRVVPVDHPDLPKVLEWYDKNVRPFFLRRADPNELAFFLSERGNRMSISTIESRFQHILKIAGLDGLDLTPHSLRHSSVTHESFRLSGEANRRKHGHVYESTTQGYMHIPDEYVRDEFTKATRNQINKATKYEDDDGQENE